MYIDGHVERLGHGLGGRLLCALGATVADRLDIRHLYVQIDPILSGSDGDPKGSVDAPGAARKSAAAFDEAELDRLAGLFFPKARRVIVGADSEPTLHDRYVDIVLAAKRDYGVPCAVLNTDGQLLEPHSVKALCLAGLDEVCLSLHGVREATYERWMAGASVDKLHRALGCLSDARWQLNDRAPRVRLLYSVHRDGVDELSELFDELGGYTIDTVEIRPVPDLEPVEDSSPDQTTFTARYTEAIHGLQQCCDKRGTRLSSPRRWAPQGTVQTEYGPLAEYWVRRLRPGLVWREDFDWRDETYEDYCERTRWHGRSILSTV